MDPVAFDKDGNMSVRITDTPQWAPGVVANPAKAGESGSIPVTINKMRAMNALSRFSSQQPGHEAAYAVDNSSGTWWEPTPTDAAPALTIELSPATRFDVVQLFTIDSVRLLFTGGNRFGRNTAPATNDIATASTLPPTKAYQYKIDVSTDGNAFTTVLDQSANAIARNTIFEEIPPTKCRFVRLTLINWPRTTPLGVIEFTVFGKPSGSLPAAQPIPGAP
jgi:xylan 1,4-beta-xylosidase